MIEQLLKQASAFEQQGQNDLALNAYNVVLELLPQSDNQSRAAVYFLRGRLKFRLNNRNGAMDDLNCAIKLNPEMLDKLNGEFSRFYEEGCHSNSRQ